MYKCNNYILPFVTVNDMKKKWRHIRDNYMKYLNQEKNQDPTRKKSKYIYADALEFLKHSTSRRETSGNEKDDGEEEINVNDYEDQVNKEVRKTIVRVASNPKKPRVERYQRSSSLTVFQNELLKKLENNQDDADKAFLMSLLKDYKSLDDDEKFDFKFLTLNFFRNIRQKKRDNNLLINTHSCYLQPQMLPVNPHYEVQQFPSTLHTEQTLSPISCHIKSSPSSTPPFNHEIDSPSFNPSSTMPLSENSNDS